MDLAEEIVQRFVQQRGGKRPISKILIASNGLGALKATTSMRRFEGLELISSVKLDDIQESKRHSVTRCLTFVAMATPEDIEANAAFLQNADQFVSEICYFANRLLYSISGASFEVSTSSCAKQFFIMLFRSKSPAERTSTTTRMSN